MSRSRKSSHKSHSSTVGWLAGGAFGLLAVCCACWLVFAPVAQRVTQQSVPPEPVGLTVAYSPEKADLFKALVADFNAQNSRAPDGTRLTIKTMELDPDAMAAGAVAGNFQAMSPDSSIWLGQVDGAWADAHNGEGTLVGATTRYAVSPVVIAMWRDVAQTMGYPGKPLGWSDLLAKAQSDSNFRWSHPSTASASGLLATLAEFYPRHGQDTRTDGRRCPGAAHARLRGRD